MKFYHGSMIKGLTQLQPHLPVGAHSQKPLVYLTTSHQLALHYIWDTERLGVKMPMLDIRKDGTFVFQEMFSGALEYFYKGVSGYIYSAENVTSAESMKDIPFAATSTEPVSVDACEYVPDAYEALKEAADKGLIVIKKYSENSEKMMAWIERCIKEQYKIASEIPDYKIFLEGKFKNIL